MYNGTSAPDASRPLLKETQDTFGMIPNLEAVMAGAPVLLEGYGRLWDVAEKGSLSATERQVVFQAVNVLHACDY